MGVKIMFKLIFLEWKKLKRNYILVEIFIYLVILMFFPVFFIKVAMPYFGQNYTLAIELNLFVQMGLILFGGSLISQVFIEEYKSKTMSLSFGYPISRKRLFMAKVLFIALLVFVVTIISYIFTGFTTYFLNQFFTVINGQLTGLDMITYLKSMIFGSFIITLISFVPLFFFGIWKRGTVSTVICSIVIMTLPKLLPTILNSDVIIAALCILGAISIYLSIVTAESVGEI